jgi:S1-C subfamily serine protease
VSAVLFKMVYTGAASLLVLATLAQIDFRTQKSPAQIAREAFPSVVLLTMEDAKGQPWKLGSGFFVAKDTIATNFHVIDGAVIGHAKIVGQPAQLTIAGIVALDPAHDLALLRVGDSSAAPLPLADRLAINVGDAIYAIGNPIGLEGTFSQGIVSGVREIGSDRILQITAAISPGSSGGPILDQTGTVVGVSVMSIVTGQNLNFAIPAEYVVRLQNAKKQLRPFKEIPETEYRNTLLGRIGGEPPRNGVVGENFSWGEYGGIGRGFSFTLRNKLAEEVSNVRGFITFRNPAGEPLDNVPIDHKDVIPAHSAKRITGEVEFSTEQLWWGASRYDKRTRTASSEPGKIEFRILDFSVGSE